MATSEVNFLDKLRHSQIYIDYARALAKATGLSLTLQPFQNPLRGEEKPKDRRRLNGLFESTGGKRGECSKVKPPSIELDANETRSGRRFGGLCNTAVAIRIGEKLVGFLQTNPVLLKKPGLKNFNRIKSRLRKSGFKTNSRMLRAGYPKSPLVSPERYSGIVHMLEIFAIHLGLVANQILIQDSVSESPFARRAKAYIKNHQTETISLKEISRALQVSPFYFCKMFKKGTGLTFTEYLGRVRIENAKTLLLNPNLRISEIAYEVGFGSLTHFNRIFRRRMGISPSDFRENAQCLARNTLDH